MENYENAVLTNRMSSFVAAGKLLEMQMKQKQSLDKD
jgi:hypothetical protein